MDKEKVIKLIDTLIFEAQNEQTWKAEALRYLKKELLKKPDAIVRCKDCINCVKESNGNLYCDILAVGYEPLGSKKVTVDWFCADGVKKDA